MSIKMPKFQLKYVKCKFFANFAKVRLSNKCPSVITLTIYACEH